MKTLLVIFLFLSLGASSQTLNTYAKFTKGLGAEYGLKKFDATLWGFVFGADLTIDGDVSLETYVKGHYNINNFFQLTAMAGMQDFNRLTTGVGVRFLYPIDNRHNLLVEPMWHSESSRINLGIQFKL